MRHKKNGRGVGIERFNKSGGWAQTRYAIFRQEATRGGGHDRQWLRTADGLGMAQGAIKPRTSSTRRALEVTAGAQNASNGPNDLDASDSDKHLLPHPPDPPPSPSTAQEKTVPVTPATQLSPARPRLLQPPSRPPNASRRTGSRTHGGLLHCCWT